ncbi:phage tail tape measure protein, partial [Streptobacillus moniliformis]
ALAQSGIKGEELVEYTKKAQQIAVAFDLGTKEAGEFLAKTKNQLQLGQKELFKYADTINYLSDNTASKAHEIV